LATTFDADLAEEMRIRAEILTHESAINDRELDWTTQSLELLEQSCADFLTTEPNEDAIESMSLTVGAYLGEVIRKESVAGQWFLDEEKDIIALRVTPQIEHPQVESITCYPLARVAERLVAGEQPGLRAFGEVVVSGVF